jgi:hypothetical protein
MRGILDYEAWMLKHYNMMQQYLTEEHKMLATPKNQHKYSFVQYIPIFCRSQWSRGVRHELSSPVRTLGSCVRIPLEAQMSVCFCCSI